MTETDPKVALSKAFSPEQVEALGQALKKGCCCSTDKGETGGCCCTESIAEVKGLLLKVLERLEVIAPENAVPDSHIAIMSAVFAAHLGKPVRVRGVRTLRKADSWSKSGRTTQHSQRHLNRT